MIPRLKEKYKSEVVTSMMSEFQYSNIMLVPRVEKIVISTSTKDAIQNVRILEAAAAELSLITGQKSVLTKARRSVSNFRLREGMPIGAKVTLRRNYMWEFLDRFCTVASPRIRDFRGLNPEGFDGRGNYTLGLTEQIIFPEVAYDKIKKIYGMNITFVTSASNDSEGLALLKNLGMPFAD
jgi:large subunit ribosomal protein L5